MTIITKRYSFELSAIVGSDYECFETEIGMKGLAAFRGEEIHILAVVAEPEGAGAFRNFIEKIKAEYRQIFVWEIWNPILPAVLKRYGFKPARRKNEHGNWEHGFQWSKS